MARACSEKKAEGIVTIDMRKAHNVCDYFVVSSGASKTQVGAIADNIEKRMAEKGMALRHKEGAREAMWILLDYGDVVCHVFLDETRRFYDIERLWSEAPQERFRESGAKAPRRLRLRPAQKRALGAMSRRSRRKPPARGRSAKRRSTGRPVPRKGSGRNVPR
jgi:ribosome-associated protein